MACSPQLEGGAEVGGQYGQHECGLVIHSATTNLTGEWSCVMEEYRCSTVLYMYSTLQQRYRNNMNI